MSADKGYARLRRRAHAQAGGDFTDADILHTGDTFWNGVYPFIDYSTGGHIDGMICSADGNLTMATDTHDHHSGPRFSGQQQVRA
jgi:hypothetical protein